ncbi:hypothetical protein BV898_10984 [Hypsibius exemplaris]|uniref:Uncharacterized protein n=1 Tax=Hypsibius exemplaris TaxID=2072580 RepID=A0A1W0WI21_HYPEX|nr:hypothetical protein BV898_10984 [Hypsibius exemplaris]
MCNSGKKQLQLHFNSGPTPGKSNFQLHFNLREKAIPTPLQLRGKSNSNSTLTAGQLRWINSNSTSTPGKSNSNSTSTPTPGKSNSNSTSTPANSGWINSELLISQFHWNCDIRFDF